MGALEWTCARLPTPWAVWVHQIHATGEVSGSTTMVMVFVTWFVLFVCFWLVTCQSDMSYLHFRGVTKYPTQACTTPGRTITITICGYFVRWNIEIRSSFSFPWSSTYSNNVMSPPLDIEFWTQLISRSWLHLGWALVVLICSLVLGMLFFSYNLLWHSKHVWVSKCMDCILH